MRAHAWEIWSDIDQRVLTSKFCEATSGDARTREQPRPESTQILTSYMRPDWRSQDKYTYSPQAPPTFLCLSKPRKHRVERTILRQYGETYISRVHRWMCQWVSCQHQAGHKLLYSQWELAKKLVVIFTYRWVWWEGQKHWKTTCGCSISFCSAPWGRTKFEQGKNP